MKIIYILLIIIYFINYINCITVNFNNTITNQCNNITLPCDLSLSQYWDNEITTGDDLIIDLTTSTNKNNPYFLILNNFNYQINSLTLKGQLLSKTATSSNLNLNLNSVQLNITTNFMVSTSNVNITNSKMLISNQFNTTNAQIKFYGQSNVITQVTNFNNGNLTILDQSSLSVNQQSNLNTYISHTSSGIITLAGYSVINSGIYSTGQVSIITSDNVTSLIQNQDASNNFNISSLVVSGSLLFKGNGNNWRTDQNVVAFGNITILNDNTLITIDTTVFTLSGLINERAVLDGMNFVFDYSSVTISSGYTIQGYFYSSYRWNSVLIFDGSLTTYFTNTNATYIDMDASEVNFIFNNATVGEVSTVGTWVNVTSSSTFENLLCVSCYLYIAENQTLSVLEYVDITENVIVDGTLILANECSIEAENVTVSQNGKLYINDDVKVKSIIAQSLEITNTSTINSQIVINENGYLTVDSKGILIKNNLTLSANTTLTINNYYLYDNNTNDESDGSMMPYLQDQVKEKRDKVYGGSAAYNVPVFSVSGSVVFDSIHVVISFKEPTNLYNNISIVLLQLLQNSTTSYQFNFNNMNKANIQLLNVANINNISPKINFVQQDNTIRLEFDHNENNQNSSKWKVAFIVCVTLASVFAVALVAVLVIKIRLNKFNGEYQRLINSSNKV